jgi:hypothetical protein
MQIKRYPPNITILTVVLLLGAGIMLAGCESPDPTKANILPDGYVWHDTTPLESPPKTQPWVVEDDIDTAAHNLSKEQWLHAADDLVTSLINQQGGLPSRLLLQPAGDGSSAVMRGYDSYLRELLITRDISVTTDPARADARLVYDVNAPGEGMALTGVNIINTRTQTMRDFLKDLQGKPVLKLTLALKAGGRRQAAARGLYYVHGQQMQRYEWALMPVPRYEETTTTGTFND